MEELVQSFLISRETLSVRMLDDSLDPTPLLKEIRDDKVATIIIDANASVSYRILKKVRNSINHCVSFMFKLSSRFLTAAFWVIMLVFTVISNMERTARRRGLMSSVFVLQANELGMMSAFYKYILTTMVRSSSRSHHPHLQQ